MNYIKDLTFTEYKLYLSAKFSHRANLEELLDTDTQQILRARRVPGTALHTGVITVDKIMLPYRKI